MRFILIWMFIFSVGFVDVMFTYLNHKTMHEWEMNPFQIMILDEFGYQYCILYRMLSYVLALFVAIKLVAFRKLMTALCLIVSLILTSLYLIIFVQEPTHVFAIIDCVKIFMWRNI